MPPKISVVVPFFNVEEYIRDCLDSLAAQSLRDLEVIMVDDGSTDGSTVIAKEFAEHDARFKLVQQDNQGLGGARNTGARHATGTYLAFVDSDDLVPANAYALLTGSLDRTGSDLAAGKVLRFNDMSQWQSGMYGKVFEKDRERTHITREPELIRDRIVCNKVFRRSFWDAHGLEFPGDLYEDTPVAFPAHVLATAVDVVKEYVYKWRLRPNSITGNRFELDNLQARLAMVDFVRTYAAEKAPRLVAAWDSYVLENDFESLVGAMAGVAEEERGPILELAAAELERVKPAAIGEQKIRRRLMLALIKRRKLDELLELFALTPAQLRGIAAERRGRLRRRWYARYPYLDDASVGVPQEVYDVTDEIELTARVRSARWVDGLLHIEGHARLDYLEAAEPGSYEISVWLRDTKSRARINLPVTRVHRPDVTADSNQDGLCYDWSGWEIILDPARLGRREATWQLHAQVVCDGLKRSVEVRSPWLGRDLWPGARSVATDTLIVPVAAVSGRFSVRVRSVEAAVTGSRATEGMLELEGWAAEPRTALTARVNDGTAELSVPLEAVGDRGFRARLPLNELIRGIQRPADLTNWDFRLTGGGEDLTLHLGPGFTEAAYGLDSHEIAITRTRYGTFRVVERASRPVVQEARWDGDLLVVTGYQAAGVPHPDQLVIKHRVSGVEHVVPLEWDGDRFTVAIAVREQPRFAESLPIGTGTWDLYARGTGPDVTVVVERTRIETLPFWQTVGHHDYVLNTSNMDSLELRAVVALSDAERGPYAARRRQETEYVEYRRRPIRKMVVMDSFDSRQYSDSPRALAEELTRQALGYEIVWVSADGQFTVPEGERVVLRDSLEHYEVLATASHVVANNPMPPWYVKREGQIYLQTWHGTPLKKIGFDIPAPKWAGADDYLVRFARDVAQWDHLVSPNPFSTPIFARAFAYDGSQLEFGYPRNDLLRSDRAEATAARVRELLGIPAGKKVVLYAPTWRDDHAKTGAAMRIEIDLDDFEERLGDDHVLLVRGHINVRGGIEGSAAGRLIDVTRYPDIADLYVTADVLITDYSSVMFDFAVTRKPILFFTYDLAHYRDVLRGFYFDFETEAPGPLLSTSAEVIEALSSIDAIQTRYATAYTAFTDKFCPWDDGGASGRIIDRIFRGC